MPYCEEGYNGTLSAGECATVVDGAWFDLTTWWIDWYESAVDACVAGSAIRAAETVAAEAATETEAEDETASQTNTRARNTKFGFPPSSIARPFDSRGWDDGNASFTSGYKNVMFENMKNWWLAFKDEGERLKFDPHDLEFFDPQGPNWEEGEIGSTTSTETQLDTRLVKIDWLGYGYYINTDFCARNYTDGINISDGYRSSDTVMRARLTGDYINQVYDWARPSGDESEDELAAMMELKGCLDGQMLEAMDDELELTDSVNDGLLGAALDEMRNYSCIGRGGMSDKYVAACRDGENHALKPDTYFVRVRVIDNAPRDETLDEGGNAGSSGGGGGGSGSTTSGGNTGSSGSSGAEGTDTEPPQLADPKPLPEDPLDVLDPCTVEAIAGGSEFYVPGDQATPDNQKEPRLSAKQTIYEALLSPVNNLSKEQVAAIMANIEGVSGYNPASVAVLLAAARSDEEISDEETSNEVTITSAGLIHWSNLELAALMHSLKGDDLFSPFFSESGLTEYNGGGDAVIDGDAFFQLADENKVSEKADNLLNLEIRRILSNIDGSGFRIGPDATTIEGAVNYFYNHLILTDGTTPAPDGYIEAAQAILDEFKDLDVEEEEPTEAEEADPSCIDGFKRNPAGPTTDLLDMIKSVTKDRTTKAPLYGSILVSQNIAAQYDGRDAFAFVAAVMRASGYHTNYPVASAADVAGLDNLKSWKKIISGKTLEDIKDADLKAGDVLIETTRSTHTMIYIGEQDFNDGKPFVMANTGNSFPYYVNRDVDKANIYNVWRRQTLTREQ